MRFSALRCVWLLGLALGGCQSCCHDPHEPMTITVTDAQIAAGFSGNACRVICAQARVEYDAVAASDTGGEDADVWSNTYAGDAEVSCSLSGHQLTCEWVFFCPPG
jgi:hypothetical protein